MGNSVSSFQGKGGENTSNSDLLRQNNKKRERKEKNKQNKTKVLFQQITNKLKEVTLTDRIPNSHLKVQF